MVKISKNYTTIAPYYDLLMKRVRYREWMMYIESIIKMYKSEVKTILDIACGTGNGLLNLSDKYEHYIAFDRSLEMLKVFKTKLNSTPLNPFLFVADVRQIPLRDRSIDAAFSIFDSLNNLLSKKDMKKALEEVYRILNEGGVFTFDLNTPYVLKEQWGTKTRIEEDDEIFSIWRTRYSHGISELHITVFVQNSNNTYTRVDEFHRERGYDYKEVLSLLHEAGFSKAFAYEHMSFSPPRENTYRINYVAVK